MSLIITGGGGTTFCAILYTLKTSYKILGLALFSKITSQLSQTTQTHLHLGGIGLELGGYISQNANIEQEILALVKDLKPKNRDFVLRQIARCKEGFEKNEGVIYKLTRKESKELQKLATHFYPQILKLSENLYAYKGYFLPERHFEEGVFFYEHSLKVLHPQTLAKMRQKDIIDVGGFIGDSAIIFERKFTDKKVYTFEPTKKNFKLMKRTLKLNNAKRIVPVNLGLGAEESQMQINILGSASSIQLDWGYQSEKEDIKITTLDSFVRENKIEVGFIKVDIEGFEMEFLKGAKETIMQQKPAMLISIYHQPSDYFGIKPLIESWNLGYKFKIHKGVDSSVSVETALFCEILE